MVDIIMQILGGYAELIDSLCLSVSPETTEIDVSVSKSWRYLQMTVFLVQF